ncbi:MAG: hypothetical protein OXL97_01645 [Chloroflexota bacterium]|nr:hypothetical protein [Chloroflexota bacterium]MDE2886007.1 hypothetical protein [Chloroflexota bacterium]
MTSIGELNERSLHRALKERYAVTGSETERVVDGFVTDVVAGGRIVEVQTGSFGPLRNKLLRLLDAHPVTLVHPVARDRYLVRAAEDPALPATRRRSPKHGSVFDVFAALVSIPSLLAHPNLTLEVVMTVEEEVRTPRERRGRWGRDWSRVDRRLVDVVETHTFESMADLFALVDAHLPETFTTSHIATAMRSSRDLAQQAAYCFREGGVIELSGKSGNALVYRRVT